MMHELRIYPCLPERLPALQQRFETATLAIWERLGIRSLGFWTTMIGGLPAAISYLLEWRSLAEREQKWAEFIADPERQEAKAKSEADRPLVANIASSLLRPTSTAASPNRRNNHGRPGHPDHARHRHLH
ncbi:NIPSNAP family protein [Rhizobium ruizarguesonis]|uniref:NIPSNAP family protein n=1 Tax=Rhizobium ruizarguesonis TaxID=2081791 RepID=UPI0010312DD6|nr:NIPSNAP family protein [Rhizobium ruizarguesonis]